MSDETELTPEEKMEFDKLPRDAAPSGFVWQRIVRDLREDGTLRGAGGGPGVPAPYRRLDVGGRRVRPWLVAAVSMAASLALFASGALMGHWLGARSTERAFLAAREQDAAQLAQRVQEAGSAYVLALAALGDSRPVAGQAPAPGTPVVPALAASEIRQGREAALAALYGAAVELARLAPGDPDVSEVIRILEGRRFQGIGAVGTRQQTWY
jgi:hypothetical protein